MRPEAVQRQAEEALAIVQSMRDAVSAGHAADHALAACFRQNRRYGSRDRRLFSAATFAYFRWKGWVDRLGDPRAALAAACWLDGETESPALHRLAQQPPPLPPNTSLEVRAEALARWFKLREPPTPVDLFPPWTFDEVLDDGAPSFVSRFAFSLQQRPPLWLRCRTGYRDRVTRHLAQAGIHASPDARLPDALRIDGAPSAATLHPILHTQAEIQDIASQAVVRACAPQPGESWWDVCAGAGGKTLHLLDALRGAGHVWCTDVRAVALRELERRTRAAGFSNCSIHQLPADPAARNMGKSFDGILLDAPCSGLGTWGRAPDARWRTPLAQLHDHRQRQIDLLHHAFSHLKPGGRMLYAVCSLTRSETRRVLDTFFQAYPEIARPYPVRNPFASQYSTSFAIYPATGPGIGMWIAGITKIH